MWWLYLLVFGSLLAGVVLALVWWLIWGRKAALPAGPVRGFTFAAGLLVLLGEIVVRFVGANILLPFELPRFLGNWYADYRFISPLLIGILGLVLLSFPVQERGGRGAADLTPRSPVSFARPRWFIAPSVLLVLILLITIIAGAVSQPEESSGRYMMYAVELGGERSAGTSIYGWFYSVPSLIVTGVLMAMTIVALFLVARPALVEDRALDTDVRTIRTRNIVAAGTGALLLHLSLIFSSLAGTASIRGSFATSEGPVRFWTSFSALGPALITASMLCAAFGVALWASVALSAIPAPRRAGVTVGS